MWLPVESLDVLFAGASSCSVVGQSSCLGLIRAGWASLLAWSLRALAREAGFGCVVWRSISGISVAQLVIASLNIGLMARTPLSLAT